MSLDSLNTSEDFNEFASAAPLAADVDIATEFGEQVVACREIRCGVGGDLHVLNARGRDVMIHNVLAGEPLTIAAKVIYCDTTTAEQILVLI